MIGKDVKSIFIYFLLCLTVGIPVRMDWSTRRVVDLMEMILMSAGTLSPTIFPDRQPQERQKKKQKTLYVH